MPADVDTDLRTMKTRRQAIHVRTVDVPKAEEAAAKAKALADRAKALLGRPLDQTTFADLAAELPAFFDPREPIPVGGLVEVAGAVCHLANHRTMTLRMMAQDRAAEAHKMRTDAERTLWETGDPGLVGRIQNLRSEAGALQRTADGPQRDLQLADRIAGLESLVARLIESPHPDEPRRHDPGEVQWIHNQDMTDRQRLAAAREELARLRSLQAAGNDADAAAPGLSPADEKRLATIRQEEAELQDQLLTDPRAMRWAAE
jgi:hypothetical protein